MRYLVGYTVIGFVHLMVVAAIYATFGRKLGKTPTPAAVICLSIVWPLSIVVLILDGAYRLLLLCLGGPEQQADDTTPDVIPFECSRCLAPITRRGHYCGLCGARIKRRTRSARPLDDLGGAR